MVSKTAVALANWLMCIACANAAIGETEVTPSGAQVYRWLVYRWLAEAAWDIAARAGTETPFAQRREVMADQANFSKAATEHDLAAKRPDPTNHDTPVPVGDLDVANGRKFWHRLGCASVGVAQSPCQGSKTRSSWVLRCARQSNCGQ